MGKFARKTPYKKFLKQEKTKTKLKVSHKTVLPKGQNLTNTTMKVKKIIIKSQMKEPENHQILPKYNLNIKDLLSKLHNRNTPLRINALTSLSEVINSHSESILNNNLAVLLTAASNSIIDKEYKVRAEAIKLLSVILNKASELQLNNFFEILMKYLACAMTHIDFNIRESSLAMFDILINTYPHLTAMHCQRVIFPAFLDLISTKLNESERKLSLLYDDKMTTNIWRIKVLTRLQALIKALFHIQIKKKSDGKECNNTINWCDSNLTYASLFSCPYDSRKILTTTDLVSKNVAIYDDFVSEIKTYTEALLPLLLHIFVEVVPRRNKQQSCKLIIEQCALNDAAVLSKLIMDIVLLLRQIFELSDSSEYVILNELNKFSI